MATIDDRAQWMQWHLQGWTYGMIAKEAGVSRQRVFQLLTPPKPIREFVAQRAGYQCERCHTALQLRGHVHQTNGRLDEYEDIDHLQYLCWPCHHLAHEDGRAGAQGTTEQMIFSVPSSIAAAVETELERRRALKRNISRDRLLTELLDTAFEQGLHLYPPKGEGQG